MKRLVLAAVVLLLLVPLIAEARSFEEIMAEVSEYPGPNEPLYVPSEEAIWLTDLEGHADIYDDDSIKINYAEWFDQSQITKIDVYRNGIRMRFLSDKLDVLTNDQMKTFDGNPAERSPSSSHTDHAIWGYEYEFRLASATESPEAVSVTIKNPVHFSGEVYAYIEQNWPYETSAMSDQALKAEFSRLRSLGFAGIEIDTYYYMHSDTSTSLFAKPNYDPSIHWTSTPSDSELRRMLRLAQQSGLKTWLRLQVQLSDSFKNSVGRFTWRGSIQPSSVSEWFRNYRDIVLDLALLAESENVDILDLGVELESMQQHRVEWAQLASQVRDGFSGIVSYSEATNLPLQHYYYCNGTPVSDLLDAAFWRPFDQIAMNAWPNSEGCFFYSQHADQSFSSLVEVFDAFWRAPIDYYRRQHPAKPISFGETGSRNANATLKYGYQHWDTRTGTTDYQEVADFWAAILLDCESLGIRRVAAWTYWIFSEELPDWRLFNFKGTPAEAVISSFLD